MIDLHTHTTASDGRCRPGELIAQAAAAGIRTLSVTDHDTVGGSADAEAACRAAGIEFVSGIEITAVRDEVDVHVLGYFFDATSPTLATFLAEQRQRRLDRVREIVARLARLGIPLDAESILRPGIEDGAKSAGRPWIARALVAAGQAASTDEAFDRWLARGRPAFVARLAAGPDEIVARIHEAGGVASFAHPGLVRHDEWLPGLVDAGLDALEAYHSEHDAAETMRYLDLARRLGLALSGGSDYHGDPSHGAAQLGGVALPPEEFEKLKRRRR